MVVILGGGCGGSGAEPVDQELEFGLGMSVAGQPDLATVSVGDMHIDDPNGGELFQRAAGSEPGRQSMKPTVSVICMQ